MAWLFLACFWSDVIRYTTDKRERWCSHVHIVWVSVILVSMVIGEPHPTNFLTQKVKWSKLNLSFKHILNIMIDDLPTNLLIYPVIKRSKIWEFRTCKWWSMTCSKIIRVYDKYDDIVMICEVCVLQHSEVTFRSLEWLVSSVM